MASGLEMRALDGVRTRSLAVSGMDLLHGSIRQITMSSSKRSPSVASVVVLFGNQGNEREVAALVGYIWYSSVQRHDVGSLS